MRLDLNLASVLEAVMVEGNVTRAAANLALSQSATSNALRRARRLTGDELFIKVADGVRPTARMSAMWPELHRSLASLRATLVPQDFDARSDSTTFRVAITDSIADVAVPEISQRLRAEAPSARIAFSIHTNAGSIEGIERGALDCAVGMFPVLPRSMHVQGLAADRYGCVMRRNHRLARQMSLDDFVEASHVLVTPSGQDLGVVDGWLSLQGRSRKITHVVNRFADALRIVAEGDLLTCVPTRFFHHHHRRLFPRACLVVRDLPFEAEKILYKLVWHERVHMHPAHQWLRSVVAQSCGMSEAGSKGGLRERSDQP